MGGRLHGACRHSTLAPGASQVTEAVLRHDIEDAWRLQSRTLGCHQAADALGEDAGMMFGECAAGGPFSQVWSRHELLGRGRLVGEGPMPRCPAAQPCLVYSARK